MGRYVPLSSHQLRKSGEYSQGGVEAAKEIRLGGSHGRCEGEALIATRQTWGKVRSGCASGFLSLETAQRQVAAMSSSEEGLWRVEDGWFADDVVECEGSARLLLVKMPRHVVGKRRGLLSGSRRTGADASDE